MTAPTRRSVLGSLAAAPLSTLPSVAAALALTPSSPFDRALAEYRRLRSIDDDFDRDHWSPMNDERKRRYAEIPDITVSFRDAVAVEHTLSTANPADVAMARFRLKELAAGRMGAGNREYHRACRRLLAGVRWRTRQFGVIGKQLGDETIDDRAEALGEAAREASWTLIETPVDHVGQLAIKIEHITKQDAWTCEDAVEAVRRDAKRLAGAA